MNTQPDSPSTDTPNSDPTPVVQPPGDPAPQPLGKPIDTEPKAGEVQGEGDYVSARKYGEDLRRHVATHDIEKEARDAAPRSEEEAEEMEDAEAEGRSRAVGDEQDPAARPG